MNEMKLARGLGWFSIGLGLTEVVAGRSPGRTLGIEDQSWLLRTFGVREIASGVLILSQDKPTAGVWSRVAGDVMDLAALGSAYREDNPERVNVGLAIGTVATITAPDYRCARRLNGGRPHGSERLHRMYVADDPASGVESGRHAFSSR